MAMGLVTPATVTCKQLLWLADGFLAGAFWYTTRRRRCQAPALRKARHPERGGGHGRRRGHKRRRRSAGEHLGSRPGVPGQAHPSVILGVPGQKHLGESVCCLLVLNLVSSTLPCIRQPGPRLRVLGVCDFV